MSTKNLKPNIKLKNNYRQRKKRQKHVNLKMLERETR